MERKKNGVQFWRKLSYSVYKRKKMMKEKGEMEMV